MNSMNKKILAFLREAGDDHDVPSSSIRSLRSFEGRHDLDIMGMLEKEWFEEQVSRDLARGFFTELPSDDEEFE